MAEGPSAAPEYLQKLFKKADEHCRSGRSDKVSTLYRNKSSSYFVDIRVKHSNIIKPILKDNGGDPRCPINGRLKGVFFGVTLWKGDLPTMSPYGDTRVKVPLERLFDDSARLYFADFYCMLGQRPNHYVILVLTKPDTDFDRFCQENLIRLDERKNVFLKKEGSTYKTLRQGQVWVEVFYTHEVDIADLELDSTELIGKGSSSAGGIPKTPGCKICNVPADVESLADKFKMLSTDQSEK